MLKFTKSTTLTGQSMVGNKQVASFNANINTQDKTSNVYSSTMDQDLYIANKAEVRKDLADFTLAAQAEEDRLFAEDVAAETAEA